MIDFDELFKTTKPRAPIVDHFPLLRIKSPNHSKTGFAIFLTTNSQP